MELKDSINFKNTVFQNSTIENLIINKHIFLKKCIFVNTKINNLKASLWNKIYLYWKSIMKS